MKQFFIVFVSACILSLQSFAQKDTVEVPDVYTSGGQEGTLNVAVETAIAQGKLSNTVFKLIPYGLYILTGTISTANLPGETLEIVAPPPGNTQQTSPPMIAWTTSTAPNKTFSFDIAGEIIMKNVWLLYGSTDGTRTGSAIRVGDSASVSGGRCTFENVIFDYAPIAGNAAGCVQIFATHFKGKFTNCYFKNCGDQHFRYYGRALSFAYDSHGLHADSVLFENCTFANIGYVYMQEGAEYGDNVHFNHCTFYNVTMFTLESGWWWKMSVTNSLFVNTYMFGRIPINDGEGFGGTINITPVDSFGFSPDWNPQDGTPDFTDATRKILFLNNNYYVDQWLVDWMGWGPNGNPYSKDLHSKRRDDEIPQPMPMMNSDTKRFFDSLDFANNKVYPYIHRNQTDSLNPGFILPPLNLDSLKQFLYYKWYNNADVEWSWKPENSYRDQLWPLEEDMSYTNASLKTAAMGGFPSGDLYRWWPNEYQQWLTQADAERNRIFTWLETGSDPASNVEEIFGTEIPSAYKLGQNYPNPFNPETKIEYSLPKAGFISLKVFDLLGEEVALIFEGMQREGNYIATFNAAKLSSGVYLYQLQAGDITLTKKFIYLK